MKALLFLPVLLLAVPTHAALRLPARPEAGRHVVDLAHLISPGDVEEIQAMGERLWQEQNTQLVVVTIDSMAQYGGARMPIENFAWSLFEAWDIGQAGSTRPDENMGILLLVSRLDRKARIELGPGWGTEKDDECWKLMQDFLVPAFKKEEHSSALVFGASALDRMARGLEMPRVRFTREHLLGLGVGGLLLLWTIVSLVRSGSEGWAWGFWSAVFGILWTILQLVFSILLAVLSHNSSRYHRRRRWGSSYGSSWSGGGGSSWSSGGGSWGGGGGRSSGGGGGATGSW